MKAVLLGATKGIGRALARQMAERGEELFLLGRDATELARSAADLQIRGAKREVHFALCNLLEPEGFSAALHAAESQLGSFDTVVVSAGVLEDQERLETDTELRDRLLKVNFGNTIHFCEEAREHLLSRGGGTLAVFSSVSGDRARKPVFLYGATKAGLSHYLEGLDHKYRRQGLRTVLIKPGFVRTGMTAHLEEPPFAGDPVPVAREILRAIDRGRPVVYAPPVWRAIMLVVRWLPRGIMRRVEF
jgi:short-subunit dehydrogenase